MIIVFAKAPGQAKTRLIPRLGAWGAARLHMRLVRHAVRTARAAACGPVELHVTKDHSLFDGKVQLQRGRDLGERMRNAFARARKPAILIGSDCPALEPADLRRAWRWLRGDCEVVLAPAEDGGYALIGLKRVPAGLFEGRPWGSSRVYADTVKKLSGSRWRALRRVWDVDRPDDLERLAALPFALRSLRSFSASRPGARR